MTARIRIVEVRESGRPITPIWSRFMNYFHENVVKYPEVDLRTFYDILNKYLAEKYNAVTTYYHDKSSFEYLEFNEDADAIRFVLEWS